MFKKVTHIILASLIFVSSTGFTVNMHYCHDQLIDHAFMAPAQSCCDIGGDSPCHSTEGIGNMNHCKDVSISMDTTDDFMVSAITFKFENTHISDLLFSTFILNNLRGSEDLNAKEAPWYKKPPPYQEVVLSQIQSFLF